MLRNPLRARWPRMRRSAHWPRWRRRTRWPHWRRRTIVLILAALGVIAVAGVLWIRPWAARYVPYTFTVNSTADGGDANLGDGVCQTSSRGKCTLRAAIEQSNARAGRDTITFKIPGAGPHTIAPAYGPLPTITQPVVIDGYTQPGASPNTNGPGMPSNALLRIELAGAHAGPLTNGLTISAGGSTIRGLAINRFAGGSALQLDKAGGNFIEGNFIGIDLFGTAPAENEIGVDIFSGSNNNTVGGTAPAARNVIASNQSHGVQIAGTGNFVQGNFIGTDPTGTRTLGNGGGGVHLVGSYNSVGGSAEGAGNTIAHNLGAGVSVAGATNNAILANAIFSNGGPSIELGARANGSPRLPILSSAMAASPTVEGRLTSALTTTYRIELFSAPTCGRSGHGEGRRLVGFASATTDDNGQAPISVVLSTPVSVGEFIAATATDPDNNTSQFSKCLQVPDVFTVNASGDGGDADPADGICQTLTPGECTLRAAIEQANSTTGLDLIKFDIPGAGPHTIVPALGALPAITQPVMIDGYTQPGAVSNTSPPASTSNAVLKIELSGAGADYPEGGLSVSAGGSTIRGLAVNRFAGTSGIRLLQAGGNVVEGNFIGTDPTGSTALGNEVGVDVASDSSANVIGGTTPAARNVISGNGSNGVQLFGAGNSVQGNAIGTDPTGVAPLGNGGRGVHVAGGNNAIGGAVGGAGNIIANNRGPGVYVAAPDGSAVLSNAIFANGGPGIDLSGASRIQEAPVLKSAVLEPAPVEGNPIPIFGVASLETTVQGTLRSNPATTYRVELFSNPTCAAAGTTGGRVFLGAGSAATDRAGNAAFEISLSRSVPVGEFITATATDPRGNTSAFSACVQVTEPRPPADPNATAVATATLAVPAFTGTPTATSTTTTTPVATETPTETLTMTPMDTTTPTSTPTATLTPTTRSTETATPTPTATEPPTVTETPDETIAPRATSPTLRPAPRRPARTPPTRRPATRTPAVTRTATAVVTRTATPTRPPTATRTRTRTPAPTRTRTVTPSPTLSPTITATATPRPTTPEGSGPSCTSTRRGTGALDITVSATSGLTSVTVRGTENATLSAAPFAPGTTAPVIVTFTRVASTVAAHGTFDAVDTAGNRITCDRVMYSALQP